VACLDRIRTIAAPPTEIWDLLAEFGAISAWVDKVDHSCDARRGPNGGPVGTVRRVQFGCDALIERITDFDPQHTLGYDIEGLPKLFGWVGNQWRLTPADDGSTLVTLRSSRGANESCRAASGSTSTG
jgi:hypothetical protein